MKLAEWARSFGVRPQTAYRWLREDRMPAPARRLSSGTIAVDPPEARLRGQSGARDRAMRAVTATTHEHGEAAE
ncbi:hypothetical protein [Kutzneria sp. NPDC052558]|uniref:hypothetical protein n=1 Tax=Kutzneria sp. NPDC052558 TaxID=3364121 RepID=UPI0037C5B1EC